MKDLSPIILFVYNRPNHTSKTLEALKLNTLASQSELFIFSDAAKNSSQIEDVNNVRDIISDVKGFKNVTVYNAEQNKGLATSVINGVTAIINKYEKVIVLEDDLVTSPHFLAYMNSCLESFELNNNIWSISGYSPELEIKNSYKHEVYLAPRGCSWGWATWKDRWATIDWNVEDYQRLKLDIRLRREFNKGGNDLAFMLGDQMAGRIDSWAIRWVYSQFKQSKYTVYPLKSLIMNNGMDFSGTHAPNTDKYTVTLNNYKPNIPTKIDMDSEILKSFRRFYNLNISGFLGVASRRIGIYKTLKKLRKKSKKVI
ncbi:Glycosyl transferase family 2 [Fictibacillus enclensis]|uniref:Sugar transferase n=1 Tax=Fictibacillus enclensis TaxID=1017270 RepID=A0A0V8J4K2_9BACL|nr:glycosyltransferase [Fictibacillus enclensis]KSU82078.1 sugar transferase [Fictibacillus enclensis]SCC30001.1 Glycosyl transferase family 2 [Fictibacillus enclensis]